MNEQIAKTILEQIGGNKFAVMTGAKEFTVIDNGLRFKIGRNKTTCNKVTVKLNSMDTYDMLFEKVSLSRKTWDVTRKTIKEISGVYCEQLQEIFTDVTGLYTRL